MLIAILPSDGNQIGFNKWLKLAIKNTFHTEKKKINIINIRDDDNECNFTRVFKLQKFKLQSNFWKEIFSYCMLLSTQNIVIRID